jgi:23S rRNA pseudoU1915 N3-methylase RlmH
MENRILPVIGKAIAETEETTDKAAATLGEIPANSFLPAPALAPEEPFSQTDAIVARGKRTDHDSLPEVIRAIWDKNAERYKKIKQAHETCKTLTAACDRYEYTSAIAELWADYKKDFDTYDHYVLVDVNEEAGTQTHDTEEVQLSAEDVKAINAARPYISKNLPKLLALVAAAKQEGFTEAQAQELESWRDRIQQRVDVLIRTKQVIKDELRQQLTEADIKLEISDSDGQGQEHSDDSPATE